MRNKLLIVFLLFSFSKLSAQYNDGGLWTKVSVNTKVVKRLNFKASASFRFDENISQLSTSFLDLAFRYKLHDYLRVRAVYRLGFKAQSEDYFDYRERLALDLMTGDRYGDFKWDYRLRSQFSGFSVGQLEGSVDFGTALRNKLTLGYKVKKKTWLWTSGELFSSTDDNNDFVISDWRWKIGVDKSLKKRRELTIAYMIQRELTGRNQVTDYVLVLNYGFGLKAKKKD